MDKHSHSLLDMQLQERADSTGRTPLYRNEATYAAKSTNKQRATIQGEKF